MKCVNILELLSVAGSSVAGVTLDSLIELLTHADSVVVCWSQ